MTTQLCIFASLNLDIDELAPLVKIEKTPRKRKSKSDSKEVKQLKIEITNLKKWNQRYVDRKQKLSHDNHKLRAELRQSRQHLRDVIAQRDAALEAIGPIQYRQLDGLQDKNPLYADQFDDMVKTEAGFRVLTTRWDYGYDSDHYCLLERRDFDLWNRAMWLHEYLRKNDSTLEFRLARSVTDLEKALGRDFEVTPDRQTIRLYCYKRDLIMNIHHEWRKDQFKRN